MSRMGDTSSSPVSNSQQGATILRWQPQGRLGTDCGVRLQAEPYPVRRLHDGGRTVVREAYAVHLCVEAQQEEQAEPKRRYCHLRFYLTL